MPDNRKVKKVITYNNLTIKLYAVDPQRAKQDTLANIEAFDSKGILVWLVEKPTFSSYYYDMQIDEEKGQLEGDAGTGCFYLINPANGRIIESYIRK